MSNQTYDLLIPIFTRMLPNLKAILEKAQEDAEARKIDPQVFLQARLAGVEVPKWDDNEKTFGELCARVDKALDYTKTFKPAQFDGAETRDIELKFPQATLTFKGRDYLLNFVLPNFYFHLTAAYAILRHNGVPLGKRDFVGG